MDLLIKESEAVSPQQTVNYIFSLLNRVMLDCDGASQQVSRGCKDISNIVLAERKEKLTKLILIHF